MFSGIVEKKARIIETERGNFKMENVFHEKLLIGQSIAHDGACMTVTSSDADTYTFFAMQETLGITNFGKKRAGDYFNVERCVKVGDRLDGHIVSGHIDTLAKVQQIVKNPDDSLYMFIQFDKKFSKYLIPKGSITINGVSLTLAQIENDILSVSLIPLTQEITNLGILQVGDSVNLEFDLVGKYIVNAHSL